MEGLPSSREYVRLISKIFAGVLLFSMTETLDSVQSQMNKTCAKGIGQCDIEGRVHGQAVDWAGHAAGYNGLVKALL